MLTGDKVRFLNLSRTKRAFIASGYRPGIGSLICMLAGVCRMAKTLEPPEA